MNAESREAVFAELRQKGIKAIKVVAADGSKANGEVRGVRKRMVALAVLGAIIVTAAVFFFIPRSSESTSHGSQVIARALPRQMISGDRKRIESASKAFKFKAEEFLARFAEPGRPYSAPEIEWPTKREFDEALNVPITYAEDEFTEQIDLKRMVVWMEYELRAYVRGGGYVSGYIRDLIKRQDMELDHRSKAEKELAELLKDDARQQEAYDFWLKANAQLKAMGIYQIDLPPKLVAYQNAVDLR